MNEMMQKMSHTMEHQGAMDQTKMQDMSKMMHEMSVAMNEMSAHMEHMAQGKMDATMMKKMQERMKEMNQMMDTMQKGSKQHEAGEWRVSLASNRGFKRTERRVSLSQSRTCDRAVYASFLVWFSVLQIL
jgi:hypothetical protein